jgi:large subunit ribosomal protein L24
MRDSGLDRTTYGGREGSVLHPPRLPKHEQRRHVLFAEGDRVCVIRGREQGKINVITQVNRDSETVLIKDVNMVCVRISFLSEICRASHSLIPSN